ncbi:MAG: hypothetical protein AAGC47_07635 [Bacteroidota bacterium]
MNLISPALTFLSLLLLQALLCPSLYGQEDGNIVDSVTVSFIKRYPTGSDTITSQRPKTGYLKEGDYYMSHYKYGKRNGQTLLYSQDSTLKRLWYYKEDVVDGPNVGYYQNGRIRYIIHYKDGKADGDRIVFYPNGVIAYYGKYKNDHPNGPRVFNHLDGRPLHGSETWELAGRYGFEGEFYRGYPIGEIKLLNTNGKYAGFAQYKDGNLHGIRKISDENGELKYFELYLEGIYKCSLLEGDGDPLGVLDILIQEHPENHVYRIERMKLYLDSQERELAENDLNAFITYGVSEMGIDSVIQSIFDFGIESLDDEKYLSAEMCFRSVVDIRPRNCLASYNLALSLIGLEMRNEAKRFFAAAQECDPALKRKASRKKKQ